MQRKYSVNCIKETSRADVRGLGSPVGSNLSENVAPLCLLHGDQTGIDVVIAAELKMNSTVVNWWREEQRHIQSVLYILATNHMIKCHRVIQSHRCS